MYTSDLKDAEWELIEPYVRKNKSIGRASRVDRRSVINAILYQSKTGCQWRLLPKDFPNQRTVCHYYYRWINNGTWEKIHDGLVKKCREQKGKKK